MATSLQKLPKKPRSRTPQKPTSNNHRWFGGWTSLVIVVIAVSLTGLIILRFSRAGVLPAFSVQDMGALQSSSAISARDVATSTPLGSGAFWAFGDTEYNGPATPPSIYRARSSSGATSSLANPLMLSDHLDANGLITQLIPFTPAETAANLANTTSRVALWPSSWVSIDANNAYLFYAKYSVTRAALNYSLQEVGLATMHAGNTQAVRLPTAIFGAQNSFTNGAVHALKVGEEVYVYGCTTAAQASADCKVGRVAIGQIANPSAYQFWDGKVWQASQANAATMLKGSTSGLGVTYQPDLKKYVVVYIPAFQNQMLMRVADAPEGPWSDAEKVLDTPAPNFTLSGSNIKAFNYATAFHQEFAASNQLVVSYYHPLTPGKGSVQLVRFSFAKPVPATPSATPAATPSSTKSSTALNLPELNLQTSLTATSQLVDFISSSPSAGLENVTTLPPTISEETITQISSKLPAQSGTGSASQPFVISGQQPFLPPVSMRQGCDLVAAYIDTKLVQKSTPTTSLVLGQFLQDPGQHTLGLFCYKNQKLASLASYSFNITPPSLTENALHIITAPWRWAFGG